MLQTRKTFHKKILKPLRTRAAGVRVPLLVGVRVPGPLLGHKLGHSLCLVFLTTAHALPELRVNQLGSLNWLKSEHE